VLIDGRRLPDGAQLAADVCVIGAGPAGTGVAGELAAAGVDVLLVESGGLESDAATQSLGRGRGEGREYHPLHRARVRMVGGSSGHWLERSRWTPDGGLRSRPFDPLSFEWRPWLAESGWPIARAEIDPYYRRAWRLAAGGLPYPESPPGAGAGPWLAALAAGGAVEPIDFWFTPRDSFAALGRRLAASGRARLLLHTTVVGLERAGPAGPVIRARAATLAGGRFTLAAPSLVVAGGGIENARLLLASGIEAGGLVGRYFTEHLHVDLGLIEPLPGGPLRRQDLERRDAGGYGLLTGLRLSDERQRREGLLGLSVSPVVTEREFYTPGLFALDRILRSLAGPRPPHRVLPRLLKAARYADKLSLAALRAARGRPVRREVIGLMGLAEQSPHPENRVLLSGERDALGLPLPLLRWRLHDIDRRSIDRSLAVLDAELRRAGVGRVRPFLGRGNDEDLISGSWHHMGTTRMSADPRRGVVDRDCRVHETPNLYVAGSSVFPTGGSGAPTLTVVALALRLADHLRAGATPLRVAPPPA
jgi:choline dehydrogenase-like flavoprotein